MVSIAKLQQRYYWPNGKFKFHKGEYISTKKRVQLRKQRRIKEYKQEAKFYIKQINEEYRKKHKGKDLPKYDNIREELLRFFDLYDVSLSKLLPGEHHETILYGLCFAIIKFNIGCLDCKNHYKTYKHYGHLNQKKMDILETNYYKLVLCGKPKRQYQLEEPPQMGTIWE